jgi:hypothetical protein
VINFCLIMLVSLIASCATWWFFRKTLAVSRETHA